MKLMPNDKPLQKDHREISLANGKLMQKGKEIPFKVVSVNREYCNPICCIELSDFDYHQDYFTLYDDFDAYYVSSWQIAATQVSSLTGNTILLECKESS